MKTVKNIYYSAKCIEENSLDFYYPDCAKVKSIFVYFHGGGLFEGDKAFDAQAKYFADAGIAVASVNYRLIPSAKFPEFIFDCAEAIAWIKQNADQYFEFENIFVGGSSAGAYLSMMLCFDKSYLEAYGIASEMINGYIFDAGQPTTHYNVLAQRGLDSRLVRIDEAAALYFIDKDVSENKTTPSFLIFVAENDIQNRLEQNKLLIQTMLHFGYAPEKIQFKFMKGFQHCGYTNEVDFLETVSEFICKH